MTISKTQIKKTMFAARFPRVSHHVMKEILKGEVLTTTDWMHGCDAQHFGRLRKQRARLLAETLTSDPDAYASIFLASSSLAERLGSAEAGISSLDDKVIRAAMRYLIRMSTRPTPFGTMAGVAVGVLDNVTSLSSKNVGAGSVHFVLDSDVAAQLADLLYADGNDNGALLVRCNPMHLMLGQQCRYVETKGIARWSSPTLASANVDEYLLTILNAASEPIARSTIENSLQKFDPSLAKDEVSAYVSELIECRILEYVTGTPAIGNDLFTGLSSIADQQIPPSKLLKPIAAAIEDLNKGKAPQSTIDLLHGALVQLGVTVSRSKSVHAVLSFDAAEIKLDSKVVNQALECVSALNNAIGVERAVVLTQFCEAFDRRFGDAQVPLLLALDPDFGVPFGGSTDDSPILVGVPVKARNVTQAQLTPWSSFLVQALEKLDRNCETEIKLSRHDLDRITAKESNLPLSTGCLVLRIANDGTKDVPIVQSLATGSPLALLGRFAHASTAIRKLCNAVAQHEESIEGESVMLSELCHLPPDRMGNISSRPAFYQHHISLLGHCDDPKSSEISLTDILVSVADGQVVLRHAVNGCRVIPRLSCAHNFAKSELPLYRFLCQLQHQGPTNISFYWPDFVMSRTHFPRVRFGDVIVSLARWHLDAKEIASCFNSRQDPILTLAAAFRSKWRLPRYVSMLQADNKLELDLDSLLGWDLLKSESSKTTKPTMIEEVLHPPSTSTVDDLPHEIVIPLVQGRPVTLESHEFSQHRQLKNTSLDPNSETKRDTTLQHILLPRSDCLYLKVYGGTKSCEKFLLEHVVPLLASEADKSSIRWFFVRYSDPDNHLRIRVFGEHELLWNRIAPMLLDRVNSMRPEIWRAGLDTYIRENERYGGEEHIRDIEEMFCEDSRSISNLLAKELASAGEAAPRWHIAIASADSLLRDCLESLPARESLLSTVAAGFLSEMAQGPRTKIAIGDKYRLHKADVSRLLADQRTTKGLANPAYFVTEFASRSIRWAQSIHDVRRKVLASSSKGPELWNSMVASLLHMSMNRIFLSDARAQEMVVYQLLHRGWKATNAASQDSPRTRDAPADTTRSAVNIFAGS